ncbi:MAG: hypothetical protein IH851_09470 [Armatimonadetes bacterium]|nr:hypothetical protein [Armatimonadota bacterium]
MKKVIVAMMLVLFAVAAAGQSAGETTAQVSEENKVTVAANGQDVRTVLYEIFQQAEKSFIAEPGLLYSLYLNLYEVPFDTALDFICRNCGISYETQEGIYVFSKLTQTKQANPVKPATATPAKKKVLDQSVLTRTFTARLEKKDIRAVFSDISRKTGVPIEVSPEVKNLTVNAYLIETSLRYALNSITRSAKLMYSFTDHGTILISDPAASGTALSASVTNTSGKVESALKCDQCGAGLGKGWKYCPHCGNYVKNITS